MSQRRKRNTKGREIIKPYEPTPRQRDAIEDFNTRKVANSSHAGI